MPATVALGVVKVLVIDDQEFVRSIVKKMLQQIGIGTVAEAHDGNSGLEMVERELPDVVICDVQMRPVDGFSFVKSLRGLPHGRAMPVILLTAHTDAATVTAPALFFSSSCFNCIMVSILRCNDLSLGAEHTICQVRAT